LFRDKFKSQIVILIFALFTAPFVVGGWIILKWMLEREGGVVWAGLIWYRIGTSGGLL
jgi:hypothetical protein